MLFRSRNHTAGSNRYVHKKGINRLSVLFVIHFPVESAGVSVVSDGVDAFYLPGFAHGDRIYHIVRRYMEIVIRNRLPFADLFLLLFAAEHAKEKIKEIKAYLLRPYQSFEMIARVQG
ncbi:hypothetical protein SDC9_192005 [bioreactor metagenome]|uniref:Uncharacterized protein n=1 Tax=bioreactor metagenome TaxID=1076179 RepID=A0A645HZT8_9ZZZZ